MQDKLIEEEQRIKFRVGEEVLLVGQKSGKIFTIQSSDVMEGRRFYRLKELEGGLFLAQSLAAVRARDAGTDEALRKPTDIGNLRRYLFAPFDCKWNGIVRDVTAEHEHDGECDAYAVFKNLVQIVRDNGQLDHSFPARMRLEEMFDVSPYGDEEVYVAWLRWTGDENHRHLIVCDSDDERAFKVYRRPTSPASHAAGSTPQQDAEDPAEPVEDVVSRMCAILTPDEYPTGTERNAMTAILAVAREGYYSLADVEKAIRKTGERYPCISGGWASFAAQVCSEIAPKPSLAAKTGGAK